MIVLGVDVGVTGAIAILEDSGELVDVHDMNCLNNGPAKRRAINAPLLAEILAKSHAARRPGRRPWIVVTDTGRRATVRISWPDFVVENPYVHEFISARRALASARRTGKILDYLVLIVREGGRR